MKYIPNATISARIVLSVALVLAAAGAVATPAVAQSDQPDWAVQMFDDMGPMVETYNENVNASDLGPGANQLRNENVNLVVDDPANGTAASVSFRMDGDLRIQELELGTRDDATIRMSTDKATMDRIIASGNPVNAFNDALTPPNAEITISGIGMVNAVKWTVLNLLADIFG